MQNKDATIEESKIWEILDKIGPISLVALCVPLAIQVSTQPISWATGISFTIIIIAMVIGFLLDKRRTELSVKLKEHKAWVEGNRPLLKASAERATERRGILQAYDAVTRVLKNEISREQLSEERKEALSRFLEKVEAIREASIFT